MPVEPFTIEVSDHDLEMLRDRLRRTRWPMPIPVEGWAAGSERATIERLVEYWLESYDWRTQESALNELPHFIANIDGMRIHYLHFRGEREGAFPIVLTHGWPGSFYEMAKLAPRLAHPSRYGGRREDAFDVVVPSLPGFLFSGQFAKLCDHPGTADLWYRLMHDILGYERFGAHGGDLGAGVTTRLGADYPGAVAGIHLLAVAQPDLAVGEPLSVEEQAYLQQVAEWDETEGAYEHQQTTRPLTLAYGLSDSPAGLLAWLVEKYRAWSDCGGDIRTRFSDDDILTQASLYWHTNTIATSFRPYFEYRACPQSPLGRVETPTAVAVFPADLSRPPRRWCERVYNVQRYTVMPRGGHFAAHEEPQLLADDIAEFFSVVRG